MKKQASKQTNEPATIRRPGAETKVGGLPLMTIGFNGADDEAPLLKLNEEEEVVAVVLEECEGGGRGRELRHSDEEEETIV